MIDELDALNDALDGIEVPAIGLGRLERRRLHHARAHAIGAGIAVAATLAVAALVAVTTTGTPNQQRPADDLDEGALRRDGEVLVVKDNTASDDWKGEVIYARVPGESELRRLVSIDDLTAGASPGYTSLERVAWSTDGDRMAFALRPFDFRRLGCSSAAGLWVVDELGSHQLTRPCDGRGYPWADPWTWVPGATTIALANNQVDEDGEHPRAELQLLDTAGDDLRTLATLEGSITAVTPTPDGRTLFWISELSDGLSAVYATNLDDGATRTIATLHRRYSNVAISPDGSRLALTGDNVRIITMDGDVVREVESGDANGSLAWSPDGRMLAWVAHTNVGHSRVLYVWRTDTPPSEPDAVRQLDRGECCGDHVRFSPDGSTVAYRATIDTYDGKTAWKRYDVETGAQQQNMDPDVAASWLDGSWDG